MRLVLSISEPAVQTSQEKRPEVRRCLVFVCLSSSSRLAGRVRRPHVETSVCSEGRSQGYQPKASSGESKAGDFRNGSDSGALSQ